MSRIKIILLVLIFAVLGVVFVENREPISLKFLCADNTQQCLYQSPPVPLAVWIFLATLLGAIAIYLVQALNLYGYESSEQQKNLVDDDLYPSKKSRAKKSRRNRYTVPETDSQADNLKDEFSDAASFEVPQEPQNIERSGSTYSYKYREVGDREKNSPDKADKNSVESEVGNGIQEKDDEDWI